MDDDRACRAKRVGLSRRPALAHAPYCYTTPGKPGWSWCALAFLLSLFFLSSSLSAQTIYAVVLGNPKYVVGSSTLHSGLYRSIDTGHTWEHLGPQNLKAYAMDAVDSSRGRILYIAAGNGVHKSTDFGKTWKIMTDWRMTEVMDVKVDQVDPRWVYAATAWGLWRSGDGGETWENPSGTLQHLYIHHIDRPLYDTYTITAHDTLFLLNHNQIKAMVYDASSVFPTTFPIPDSLGKVYDTDYISRHHEGDIFSYEASTTDVWESTYEDHSIKYRRISAGLPTHVVHALTWLFRLPSKPLLAGTWGYGIYRREGDTWIPSGLEGSQVWSMTVKDY